ncbi:fasciclin domain-containing protein [Streptosporangium sp. NPDC004631]
MKKKSLLASALAAVALAALPVAAQATATGSALTLSPTPEPSEMTSGAPSENMSGAPSEMPSEGPSENMSGAPSEGGEATLPFGPGCAALPSSGPGSIASMAKERVATAAAANPRLSQLVGAFKEAGLVDTLNSAEGITVFAPSNEAFSQIPQEVREKLKSDKALLKKVLTYHVVSGKVTPKELKSGTLETLEGGKLTVKEENGEYTVNDAKIICGNVPTANAVVYIIDKVLVPPH